MSFNLDIFHTKSARTEILALASGDPQQLALCVNLSIGSLTSPILMSTLIGGAVVCSVFPIAE